MRALDAVLIGLAGALWIDLATGVGTSLRASGDWWWVVPAAGLGVLCADFATGVVHWFCDRFLQEETPVLGPVLIRPFREHHRDPGAMTRHGLLELHGNSSLPVIAALLAVRTLPVDVGGPLRTAFDLWLACFLAASMATNQFHLWAHHPHPPGAIRWLQRHGVILSPQRHARHHRGDYDRSYCMTSGLLNPLLDRIDFFGSLERAIRRLARARIASRARNLRRG
jgi:ubiquitin-conjugating enzyme E2 variant